MVLLMYCRERKAEAHRQLKKLGTRGEVSHDWPIHNPVPKGTFHTCRHEKRTIAPPYFHSGKLRGYPRANSEFGCIAVGKRLPRRHHRASTPSTPNPRRPTSSPVNTHALVVDEHERIDSVSLSCLEEQLRRELVLQLMLLLVLDDEASVWLHKQEL